MRVLVTYSTSTGNTKKVAEAIYGAIDGEKEVRPIKEVEDIGGYDLPFLGFPTHMMGPDEKEKNIMAKHCTSGRKVAFFVTHAALEDAAEVPEWRAKFKAAAAGAEFVGFYDCQGQMSKMVKFVLRTNRDKNFRDWAKKDNSQGQPDDARLERARAFAKETMQRVGAGQK